MSGLQFGTGGNTSGGSLFSGLNKPDSSSTSGFSGINFSSGTSSFGSSLNAPGSGFGISAPNSNLSFGTTPSVTQTQNNSLFGTSLTSTQTGFTLKPSTTSSASGFTFGAQTSAPSFGLSTTTTSNLTSINPTTTVPTLSFPNLGSTTVSSTGIGQAPSAISTGSTAGFSLPGQTSSFSQSSFSFLPTSSSTAATSSTQVTVSTIGLGGIDSSQTKSGSSGRQESRAVKESAVNQEILQTIEKFEEYVKSQKSANSEISQATPKSFHKITELSYSLNQLLTRLNSSLQKNVSITSSLKSDTAKCLKDAGMAQRIQAMPPGLQYDNSASQQYFSELVFYYEEKMQLLLTEIQKVEKVVSSLLRPKILNPEEFSLAMKHFYEAFISLAGRLQILHSSVESQKQQYLDFRKKFLRDSADVFEEPHKILDNDDIFTLKKKSSTLSGPSPFSASQNGFGLLPLSGSDSNTSFSSGSALGWTSVQPQQIFSQPQQQQSSSSFMLPGSSGFGKFNTLATPQPVENQNFQLQKPPAGNKRGKR